MTTNHKEEKGRELEIVEDSENYHLHSGLASGGHRTLEQFDEKKVL